MAVALRLWQHTRGVVAAATIENEKDPKVAVAEFIEDDRVHAGQVVGKPALPSVAGLGLEPADDIDRIVEAAAGAGSNAT